MLLGSVLGKKAAEAVASIVYQYINLVAVFGTPIIHGLRCGGVGTVGHKVKGLNAVGCPQLAALFL